MAEIELEHLTKVFPGGTVAVDDVTLQIEDGEFLVLVGPSGCGKSTLLRMIAGLEEVTRGRISVGGRDVTDLAPRRRDIAMVFQSYALYPHMNVRQNIGYGLKVRRTPKDEARRRVEEVAKLLGLDELLDRRPAQLSGGQRQRVAMGRAIVREPKAFLMDEPLSNLDAKLRVEMRASLAQLHSRLGVTTVYVTHDQTEAMTLGQRVAVLNEGRVLQVDTPQRLYQHPANLFVAAFIGTPAMNLVEASLGVDEVAFGAHRVPLDRDRRPASADSRVVLGVRPESFEAASFAPPGAPTFTVVPVVVEELGSDALVFFHVDAEPVAPDMSGREEAALLPESKALFGARIDPRAKALVGEPLELALDPGRLYFFDPENGRTLLPEGAPDEAQPEFTPAAR
ncbi:MAG TPA: sn-glycerol-3-phosphate ABC transporter ATP-binding protein UgpC [Gaiellaceae bacterium]|jgi:multiple sugar transport system ATP-binding protein|nr:sn-glycerol-3-phosphate ABC transporter ATP-binding protein UgpC [Gaiellaceae bacterium]